MEGKIGLKYMVSGKGTVISLQSVCHTPVRSVLLSHIVVDFLVIFNKSRWNSIESVLLPLQRVVVNLHSRRFNVAIYQKGKGSR